MKKLLLSLTLIGSLFSVSQAQNFNYPYVASTTLAVGAMTNLYLGSARVGQIVVTAPFSTNATANLVDTYTGALTNYVPAYTNVLSYGTNNVIYYTNYFGVQTYLTNFMLVDITNNLVAAYTNNLPTVPLSVLASSTAVINNANYPFTRGIWATNTGTTPIAITINFVPQ
jgi:hypothetical protein